MIKRLPYVKFSEEDEEKMALADWVWNSHYWIEYQHGYGKCKYCDKIYTSEMPIDADFPLCEKNPVLGIFFHTVISKEGEK